MPRSSETKATSAPMLQTGAASAAAAAILVAGVLTLLIGRTLASPRVNNLGIDAPSSPRSP